MKFTKMHGLGNDYVYVNCFRETVADPPETARRVSDRHFGIGSDGLILIRPSEIADFEMEMYNADGSRGLMCGNGIRCVAKYVYDYGLTDRERITVATGSGVKTLDLTVEDGKVALVRVDMGAPVLEAARIPVDAAKLGTAACGAQAAEQSGKETVCGAQAAEQSGEETACGAQTVEQSGKESAGGTQAAEQSGRKTACGAQAAEQSGEETACGAQAVRGRILTVGGRDYEVTCVSMGNPHCVTRVEDVDGLAIESVGPLFEHHPAFPDRVNTEFIRVLDRTTVQMRVWERGSGETWACGTGACAVAVACILNGWTENEVTVKLRGGDLHICWDREKDTVFMTGPATTVFDGEIHL